ncbi:MAG: hypothetical protein ACK5F7_15560, partial [Planctomycetaceae bacterium]
MTQPLDHPQDANQEVRIAHTDLRTLLVKIYVRLGMFQAEAQIAADRQVEADLRGLRSHGSRAAIRHAQAMDVGDVDPRGQTLTQVQTPAVAATCPRFRPPSSTATAGVCTCVKVWPRGSTSPTSIAWAWRIAARLPCDRRPRRSAST